MILSIPPDKSYRALRFVGTHLRVWPTDNKIWNYKTDLFFWFCMINYTLILLPSYYTLYLNSRNVVAFCNTWVEVSGFMEMVFIFIYCKCQKLHLQKLLNLVEEYMALEKTTTVVQYGNNYAILFLMIILFDVLAFGTYVYLEKPQSGYEHLLTSAIYPFNLNSRYALKVFLYLNQIFIILHSTILPTFDAIVALLIFGCIHRMKILEHSFKMAKDKKELYNCIQEHANVLRIIEETNYVVRFIVFKTIISFISAVLGCGLQILNNVAISEYLCQVCILLLVYSRIMLCAECADNMTASGADMEFVVYSTQWYEEIPRIVSIKCMIINRCQKLPIISLSGVMSTLDRKYLAALMYATISYLMTLRTVTSKNRG